MFEQLADKVKSDVYKSGLKEYKQKIDDQTNIFLAPLDKKLAVENYTPRFNSLLSKEALTSMTQQSK
jgi:hypothetical protein